jgi:hypothetical protein
LNFKIREQQDPRWNSRFTAWTSEDHQTKQAYRSTGSPRSRRDPCPLLPSAPLSNPTGLAPNHVQSQPRPASGFPNKRNTSEGLISLVNFQLPLSWTHLQTIAPGSTQADAERGILASLLCPKKSSLHPARRSVAWPKQSSKGDPGRRTKWLPPSSTTANSPARGINSPGRGPAGNFSKSWAKSTSPAIPVSGAAARAHPQAQRSKLFFISRYRSVPRQSSR